MAKFEYVQWLLEFLLSCSNFAFEWDGGNLSKSYEKHGVLPEMVESAFYDTDILALGKQFSPAVREPRYGIIAKAHTDDLIFVCFTIRAGKIRPISARTANKKERTLYEQEIC